MSHIYTEVAARISPLQKQKFLFLSDMSIGFYIVYAIFNNADISFNGNSAYVQWLDTMVLLK